MKRNKISTYIINIFIVVFIFLIVLKINLISPFGNNMIGISDGLAQFKPMLFDLIMKIKTGLLESYSFNNGLGNPVIFNMLYYTSSPLNIIAILFNSADKMYLSVILVKLALTSIFMTFYVSKKTDRLDIIIISTISYCFCSWFLVYYYYLSWGDIFMIFPLYHYGLEQLINKKKHNIYIFTLSYMLITNFYLCFSICVYTIFYFIIYALLYKKWTKKEKISCFFRMAIWTIVALLLSSFTIYSLLKAFTKIRPYSDGVTKSLYWTTYKGVLVSLFYGSYSFVFSNSSYTIPNIACNSLILVNIIYYFFNKNIKNKDKLFSLAIILIILNTFLGDKINFILNGFHMIRGLTYRYSFIVSFLMIQLFIKNNQNNNMDKEDKKRFLLSFIITFLLLVSLFYDIYKDVFILNFIFILSLFINFIINGNTRFDKAITIMLIILQTFVTANVIFFNYTYNKESALSVKYNTNKQLYRTNYEDLDYSDTELFYNNSNLYSNTKTDALLNSMTYSDIVYLLRDLGNTSYINTAYNIDADNYFSSMIFNEKLKNKQNRYLEKIYSVKKDIKKVTINKNKIKNNLDNLVKSMTGVKTIFNEEKYKGIIAFNQCYFDSQIINNNNQPYFYDNSLYYDRLYLNKKLCDKEILIYKYNFDYLDEAYNYLKKNQIKYSYYSDSRLEGTINVDEDQLIFTSIPYDKDWIVKIDGKRVKPIKILNSLMAIEATPGKHKIELRYKEHIIIPLLISISTFIIIIIDIKKKRMKHEKENILN